MEIKVADQQENDAGSKAHAKIAQQQGSPERVTKTARDLYEFCRYEDDHHLEGFHQCDRQKAEKALEEARKRLDSVMKDRKTHEKLREHAFERFKEELKAEEIKEIDELTSYTHSVTDKEG